MVNNIHNKLVSDWLTSEECDEALRAAIEKGGKHSYLTSY
jgi:hypothetical protein